MNKPSDTKVECYAGYQGEETPRAFYIADRKILVEKILDRWLKPDERGFKVKGSDGMVYILCLSIKSGRWEISPSS